MALKTYLLAPNFTLEPDGPIRIGNIIADPFRPTKSLSSPLKPPLTATHTDFECSFTRESSKSLNGSVWAQFLQTASAKVGGGVSKALLSEYTMDSLETTRLKQDLSDEEAELRAVELKVKAAIESGLSGTAPVYMVTGLKIAKGFRLNKSATSTREGNVSAGIPITEEVGAGADFSASSSRSTGESLQAGSDIIFAYQLHVIARKGWWRKRVEADVYAPKAAFLNIDKQSGGEQEIATKISTPLDLLEVAEENEDDSVQTLEARDGDEDCVCIAFKEA
ncbi:hypothetical protein CEP54_010488 [Fusarium duplospermum]|uniref:Uncharacterized protein n=1 Tax=Fusarium duplospermum TaxID=1325734 RepID=A0A428PJK0_9HYPO|nr:hypothetical protein CEP54_010488 [Fusarium duplospermum]